MKHLHKKRMRGGGQDGVQQAPIPPPVFETIAPPLPGDVMGVQAKIAQQAAAQNAANKALAGGSRRRSRRRSRRTSKRRSKRTSKRSSRRRSRRRSKRKQRGGGAGDPVVYTGPIVNDPTGYGYVNPPNFLNVPTNGIQQDLTNKVINTLNVGAALAAGDNQVGVLPN